MTEMEFAEIGRAMVGCESGCDGEFEGSSTHPGDFGVRMKGSADMGNWGGVVVLCGAEGAPKQENGRPRV
jgi:hypothetical protein